MQMKTTTADLTDFCLVLTPTLTAAERAGEAVRKRFTFLSDDTRTEVAATVADLVESSVARRPGGPITVSIALDPDAIRGEVSDRRALVPFEFPLAPAV